MRFALGPVVAALAVLSATTAAAPPTPDPRPACTRATIALADTLDSAHAHPGDAFHFRLVDTTTTANGVTIPGGTSGYGIVAAAVHAQRGGRGGYLALEPRFLGLDDGTHVPVVADRGEATVASATGSSRNVPGMLGAVPFAGYVLGPYAYLHHGADVKIEPGTRIPVVVGDQLALGECRIPSPKEMPTPPARRQSQEPTPAPAS